MLGFMQINHSLTQISEISPASWPQLMASKLIGKLLRKQSAWFYVPFSTRNVDIGNQSTVGLWVSKTKKLRSPCLRGGLWPRRPRPFFFFFCENILAVGAAQADDTCVASWKLTFTYHKTASHKRSLLSCSSCTPLRCAGVWPSMVPIPISTACTRGLGFHKKWIHVIHVVVSVNPLIVCFGLAWLAYRDDHGTQVCVPLWDANHWFLTLFSLKSSASNIFGYTWNQSLDWIETKVFKKLVKKPRNQNKQIEKSSFPRNQSFESFASQICRRGGVAGRLLKASMPFFSWTSNGAGARGARAPLRGTGGAWAPRAGAARGARAGTDMERWNQSFQKSYRLFVFSSLVLEVQTDLVFFNC